MKYLRQHSASIEKTLFTLLIFLAPTQLALHLWPDWAYIYGIRVDYLSPTIYPTDILMVALLLFAGLVNYKKIFTKKTKPKIAIFLFLFIFANIYFSTIPYPAAYKWLKLSILFALAFYTARTKTFEIESQVKKALLLSIGTFSLIGIAQFINQKTLGGVLYFFGERSFSVVTPGISLVTIFGKDFLRAYSTFSHPNSMAGYLLAASVLLIALKVKERKLKITVLTLSLIGFILTFSLGGLLALIVVVVFYLLYKAMEKELWSKTVRSFFIGVIVLSLSLPYLSKLIGPFTQGFPETFVNRFMLAEAVTKISPEKYFLGAGLNNFIVELPMISLPPKISWWLQPVHNIFLLVFYETGVVGLALFTLLLNKVIKNFLKKKATIFLLSFLAIIVTGLFDHYWLTLQQNLILLFLIAGLSFRPLIKNTSSW